MASPARPLQSKKKRKENKIQERERQTDRQRKRVRETEIDREAVNEIERQILICRKVNS